MPSSPPPRYDLWFTRGQTYHEGIGLRGRAAEIDTLSAYMSIKRRDSLNSPELLRITGVPSVDEDDDSDTLTFTFTAQTYETAALPSGTLWWGLEIQEQDGAISYRAMEGSFVANE